MSGAAGSPAKSSCAGGRRFDRGPSRLRRHGARQSRRARPDERRPRPRGHGQKRGRGRRQPRRSGRALFRSNNSAGRSSGGCAGLRGVRSRGHKLGAEDVAAALASELKRADLKIKSGAFDIAVAAGVLHLSPAAAPEKPDAGDLRVIRFSPGDPISALSLLLNPAPKDFSGPAPQIALLFQGPFQPCLRIDAAALANALAARAIVRESERITYEFDIHERAFFYQRCCRSGDANRNGSREAEAAAQKTPNSSD